MTPPPDPSPTVYYRERLTPSPTAALIVFCVVSCNYESLGLLGLALEKGDQHTDLWLTVLAFGACCGMLATATMVARYHRTFVTIDDHGIRGVNQNVSLDEIIGWFRVDGTDLWKWRWALRRRQGGSTPLTMLRWVYNRHKRLWLFSPWWAPAGLLLKDRLNWVLVGTRHPDQLEKALQTALSQAALPEAARKVVDELMPQDHSHTDFSTFPSIPLHKRHNAT